MLGFRENNEDYHYLQEPENYYFWASICTNCRRISIWRGKGESYKMIYPLVSSAPLPNKDMPPKVEEIYREARDVAALSTRAAAALLRVALEKLTEYLGETEGNLNTRIQNLKKQGLPERVIQSLDIVRIYANEGGAHAGHIDLDNNDNSDIANTLFFLVNFIVEKTITDDKVINGLRQGLPAGKKKGIENRDKQERGN